MPLESASSRFNPARFWLVRIGSILAVAGVAYLLQYVISPKLGSYDMLILTMALLFGGLAVSLNLINGITGQFSMGHAAFYLIGAYTSGKLTMTFYRDLQPNNTVWILSMVAVGALAAAIAGLLVGLPSLRLRGDYLAIVTLGFGEILRIIVNNQDGKNQSFGGLDVGGAFGMRITPKLTEIAYVFLFVVLCVLVARNLLKTAHGLAFLAVREDELAAEATGVPTTKIKVTAFVIGAALAGMAGALFAHFNGSISPDYFKMDVSFLIVAMVVIGGTGSITGALLAGFGLKVLEEGLRKLGNIHSIDLLSLVFALIVFTAVISLGRPVLAKVLIKAKPGLAVLGALGCLALLYAAFLNYRAEVSPVIKFAFITLAIGTAVGFTAVKVGRENLSGFGAFVLGLMFVLLIRIPLEIGLRAIPVVEENLKNTTYTPSDLRWALFAITLVIVMLVRSQGLFGHHEFSWSFLGRAFGRKTPKTAVSV